MKVYGPISRRRIETLASEMELRPDWHPRSSMTFELCPLGARYAVVLEADKERAEQLIVCYHGQEEFIRRLLSFPDVTVWAPPQHYKTLDQFHQTRSAVREAYIERYGDDPCLCEPDDIL